MKTNDLTLSAIMMTILIICSQLFIPIGPVPITLQTLAVLMIGYLLTPKNAMLTTTVYVFSGLIGLPFFSGFSGGLQSVLLPSFGFILSFTLASYTQAKYLERTPAIKKLVIAGVINVIITYAIGLSYMALILNMYMGSQMRLSAILMAGFIPFLPGDLFKLLTGIVMARRLIPFVQRRKTTV